MSLTDQAWKNLIGDSLAYREITRRQPSNYELSYPLARASGSPYSSCPDFRGTTLILRASVPAPGRSLCYGPIATPRGPIRLSKDVPARCVVGAAAGRLHHSHQFRRLHYMGRAAK